MKEETQSGVMESRLNRMLDRQIEDIKLADSKATSLLTLAASLAGGVFLAGSLINLSSGSANDTIFIGTSPPEVNVFPSELVVEVLSKCLLLIGLAFAIGAVIMSIFAIAPRGFVKKEDFDDPAGIIMSLFEGQAYQRLIGNIGTNDAHVSKAGVKEAEIYGDGLLHGMQIVTMKSHGDLLQSLSNKSDDEWDRMLAKDVYRAAMVACCKFVWVGRAVFCVTGECFSLLAFIILRVISL